jgi:hypothetical protein
MDDRQRLKVLSLGTLGLVALLALMLSAYAGPFSTTQGVSANGHEQNLIGTFKLAPGICEGASAAGEEGGDIPLTGGGSYFRMTDGSEKFLTNQSSPCNPFTFTPLYPGSQGGLLTDPDRMEDPDNGLFQPRDDPPCHPTTTGGTTDRIHQPQGFFGVNWGSATQAEVIPGATGLASIPTIVWDTTNDTLSGDLSAFGMCWSNLFFAQGDPRPTGLPPVSGTGQENECAEPQPRGLSPAPVTGTYNPATGAYTLDWRSRIGGSFGCSFTGHWHFEGEFTTEAVAAAPVVGGQPPVSDNILPILLVTAVGLIAVGGGGLTIAYARWPRRR